MKLTFTGHDLVWNKAIEKQIIISHSRKIICFAISDNYIVMCVDWVDIDSSENTYVYDINGDFLYRIKSAPHALYEAFGFYSSVGFKSSNILIAQSSDFVYEINLDTKEFVSKKYTK